jgi:hypothetical protein
VIRRLDVKGIGPIEAFAVDLDPAGENVIAAPSGSGKTTLVSAVTCALWGVRSDGSAPTDLVRDGEKSGTVTLTTAANEIAYRRTASGGTSWSKRKAGGDEPGMAFDAASKWISALPSALRDVDLGLAVVTPDYWLDLADGAGDGRALVSLLVRAIPGPSEVDVAREIAGDAWGDEVGPLATTEKRLTDANRQVASAEGALRASEEALSRLLATTLPVADADVAKTARMMLEKAKDAIVAAGEAKALHAAWAQRKASHEAGEVAYKAWNAKRATLPIGVDPVAVENARKALDEASHWTAANPCPREPDKRDVERARSAVPLESETPKPCDGVPGAKCSRVADFERLVVKRSEAFAAAQREYDEAVARFERDLRAWTAENDRVTREANEARNLLVRDGMARQALAAIGPEPTRHDPPGDEPSVPPVPDVTLHEVALRDYERADAARKQHERQVEAATNAVTAARASLDDAKAHAARLLRVRDAQRVAPSRLLDDRVAKLGLGDAVTFTATEKGGVDVRIDGRPWRRASTGERIHGSYLFRCALRRAIGGAVASLPVFVDERQSWSGVLPAPGGPSVILVTKEGG